MRQVAALVARLAAAEHWAMALYVARRCGRDPRDIWEGWASSLMLCGHALLCLKARHPCISV